MSDLIKELVALDEIDLSFRWSYSKERIDQAIAEICRLRLDVQAMRPLSLQCDRLAAENARLREALARAKDLFLQDEPQKAFIEVCAALGERQ
jgi:hypothetical protein